MPCNIFTAHYSYNGPDRVDITYKSTDPFGQAFKPTKELVFDYKNGIINSAQYLDIYRKLMLNSYKENLNDWESILRRRNVTFVCYCPPGEFCHRLLLASYFSKIGGIYVRERKRIEKSIWE